MKDLDFQTIKTFSDEETEQFGENLAESLSAGSVIALTGDLGAGKTAFTRGLARGLGYKGRVTSPTFTIVNEYLGGKYPLFHFDMYRLGSSDELYDIGFDDYLSQGGICAIEWANNVDDALPSGTINIKISRISDNERLIEIKR